MRMRKQRTNSHTTIVATPLLGRHCTVPRGVAEITVFLTKGTAIHDRTKVERPGALICKTMMQVGATQALAANYNLQRQSPK